MMASSLPITLRSRLIPLFGQRMNSRNSRIGLFLFFLYLFFYGGFVLISAFSPGTMATMPIPGINLAIVYGFGLIVAAFVLALVYGVVCDSKGDKQ